MKRISKRIDIESRMKDSSELIKNSIELSLPIEKAIKLMKRSIKNGNKIVLFGNGGSAADCQHIAAELVGKLKKIRKSYPAISLTVDTSIITSLANDFDYNSIFERQCESLVKKGDTILGISTSGNSQNVINGIKTAKKKGAVIISLLGNNGGKIKRISDVPIIVKSSSTQKIQEVHRVIYHIICEMIENELEYDKWCMPNVSLTISFKSNLRYEIQNLWK